MEKKPIIYGIYLYLYLSAKVETVHVELGKPITAHSQ